MTQTNAIGTVYVNTPFERHAARSRDFEGCMCILHRLRDISTS